MGRSAPQSRVPRVGLAGAVVVALVAVLGTAATPGVPVPSASAAAAHDEAPADEPAPVGAPAPADDPSSAPVVPALPAGFELVDVPTGQAAYDLTEFAWLGDGGLLTAGKGGTITYVPPGGTPRVVGTVPDVRAVGDHGLVGFALANDYATTGHVYLSYDKGDPASTGHGMVEEWTLSPAAAPTSLTLTRTILDGSATSPPLAEEGDLHSIDTVRVASDGTLFVSVGDNSLNNGDPRTLRAQDLGQPYGKLLHLTPQGQGVPSNPFYSASDPTSWRSMVWAYGFRNPFRFALDPRSGVVHLGDVGWSTTEEVDSLVAGSNAGWPCFEGTGRPAFIASTPTCQALYAEGSARMPIWTYRHHHGEGAAVVGGALYQGTTYPAAYRGSWFLGDYAKQQIWTMATDPAGAMTRAPEAAGFGSSIGSPVSFHPGPNGDITFGDLADGTVRRLVYRPGNRAPVASAATSTDPTTLTTTFSAGGSYDLDGDALTYAWDFGDGSTGSGASTTHTFASGDPATVTLTVTDPLGASGTTRVTVHPANHTPHLVLSSPVGRTYAVGERVRLTATATDAEDGALPVTWTTALRHCPEGGSCHLHPGQTVTGATYAEPFTDHGSDTVMVVTARATDATGAVTRTSYVASPRLHRLSITSPVAVQVDGVTTSSAQVVTGAQVQLRAPASSSFWTFSSWSDRGAASHAFTMPDADRSLTASWTTAISRRWTALGGTRSFLGRATGPEVDVPRGRSRTYAGGRIVWGATSGAHWLRGPLLAAYLSSGGPARAGLPTSDVVTVRGGARAHFTGWRVLLWSRHTGTHLVSGAIRSAYAARGWQRSCLGFPTEEQRATTGAQRQAFQGGTITLRDGQTRATVRCRR